MRSINRATEDQLAKPYLRPWSFEVRLARTDIAIPFTRGAETLDHEVPDMTAKRAWLAALAALTVALALYLAFGRATRPVAPSAPLPSAGLSSAPPAAEDQISPPTTPIDLAIAADTSPPSSLRAPIAPQEEQSSDATDPYVLKVVTADGKPVAGLTIHLHQFYRAGDGRMMDERITSEEGLVPLGRWLESKPIQPERLVAIADVFGSSQTGVVVPLDRKFGEVRMVLSGFGSLQIEVVGPEGAIIEEDFSLRFFMLNYHLGKPELVPRPFEVSRELAANAGRATLDWVECGIEVHLRAGPSRQFTAKTFRMDGPASDGESRRVQVALDRRFTRLRARVLGEDGTPLTQTSIDLLTETSHQLGVSRDSHQFGVTNVDGEVFREVDPDQLWGTTLHSPLVSRYRASVALAARGDRTADWTAPLPWPLPEGDLDLGAFILREGPLVFGGVIVDSAGGAMKGLSMRARLPTGQTGAPEDSMGVRKLSALSDSDGRFEMRGVTSLRRLALEVEDQIHVLAAPVLADVGSTNLRLVVVESGGIEGWMHPETEPPDAAYEVFMHTGGTWEKMLMSSRAIEKGETSYSFSSRKLRPGRYRLTVQSRLVPGVELARIEDILVESGQVCRDPRLQGIDLRGRLRLIRVQVTGDRNTPCPNARVGVTSAATARRHESRTDSGGVAEVWVSAVGTLVSAMAPGFLTQTKESLGTDLAFRLQPAPTILVKVEWPRDATDAQIEDARIMLLPATPESTAEPQGSRDSDVATRRADGLWVFRPTHCGRRRFHIVPASPGQYSTLLMRDELEPAEISVELNSNLSVIDLRVPSLSWRYPTEAAESK